MHISSRTTIFLLVVVLSIATFLRMYHIDQTPPGLYPDEAMNGNNALEALRLGFPEGFKVFYPENNGREGLFINIQALFLWLAGALSEGGLWLAGKNEPWVLRLPSTIFGVLTVLGTYLLTRELFCERRSTTATYNQDVSRNIALLASFFLATSFWHINFSRIGFRAIMAPFFIVWALYFFLKALDYTKEKIFLKLEIGNWKFPVLSGIFLGLGMHSYIAYRIMPLLFLAFLPSYWREKRFWTALSITAIVSLAVAAPLFFYYFQNPADFLGRTSQVSVFSSPYPLKDLGINILKTTGMLFFVGDSNWRHNIAGRPELFWPVGILFVIGIFIGMKNLWKDMYDHISQKSRFRISNLDAASAQSSGELKIVSYFKIPDSKFFILFLWLFLAMLPVVISNEGIPHALRSILMLPPIMIFAGVGGVTLYDYLLRVITQRFTRKERGVFLFRMGTVLFLSLLFFEGYVSYFFTWGQNPHVRDAFSANYTALGKMLNELPQEVPKYVLVNASGVLVRGIPMPAQTVMFVTDTFTTEGQQEKNIYYITLETIPNIPEKSFVFPLNRE